MQRPDKDFIDYENARLAERWRMIVAAAKKYVINSETLRYMILAIDEEGKKE